MNDITYDQAGFRGITMDTSKPSPLTGKRASHKSKADVLARQVHWISIFAKEDAKPFGSKLGRETILNARGKALAACWGELPSLRPSLQTDVLMIGPRRIQGILILSKIAPEALPLGDAIKVFKVLSSLRIAQLGVTKDSLSPKVRGSAPSGLWKKGYLEKPITGSAELADARKVLKGLQVR